MLLTIIVFIFVLGILVLVHELGHFVAAKRMGIKVEEFGIGLPPKIWGKKIGETLYSINLLPIGGFVRLYGEDEGESDSYKNRKNLNRAFFAKKPWQRVFVLLAGVFMNFLLGWAIISFLFTQGVMLQTNKVKIEKIVKNSPAEKAGLIEGDIISKLKISTSLVKSRFAEKNEKLKLKDDFTVFKIESPKDLVEITKKHLDHEIILVIQRKKEWFKENTAVDQKNHSFETKEIKITPRKNAPEGEGPMGVVISNFEKKVYSWYKAPFLGLKESFNMSWRLFEGIGRTLWKFVSFQGVEKDIAGPLGIAQLTGKAVKFGKLAVLEFLGLLSINLAVINILPFPALDGGRLLFIGIEAVTGKRVNPRWERYTHQAGMILLLALVVLISINDFLRIFSR